MPTEIIQWFPGHMAKTRRLIKENLKKVDVVLELLDARIPISSQNPEIKEILQNKKKIVLLNKADLCDIGRTSAFADKIRNSDTECILIDSKFGKGISNILPAAEKLLSEKLESNQKKGINRSIRAMVVGIPNVGKSTLINTISKKTSAKTENRPGVTLTPQWIKAGEKFELLDMPGVLWQKFDDRYCAENLAITGAIKNEVLQIEEIAVCLVSRLLEFYPKVLCERYKLSEEVLNLSPYEIFLEIGKNRGMLIKGGEINEERCANMLVEEFRNGKIGRITLDRI